MVLFGRLFARVTSNSRAGLLHWVDLEPCPDYHFECTCENRRYERSVCRHMAAFVHAIAHWTKVHNADDWCEQVLFLMALGHSFTEALEDRSMNKFRNSPHPERQVRRYQLK